MALAVGVAIALSAYELGQARAGFLRAEAEDRERRLREQLLERDDQLARLREQALMLETTEKINAEAYRQVEARLVELQSRIQSQAEDLAFYRGIVSSDVQQGLRVQNLELAGGGGEAGVSLKLVLAQGLRSDSRVVGTVEVDVEGDHDGAPRTLTLAELTDDGTARLEFSFRYFQNLETRLRLPDGFAPSRINVRLRPRGKGVDAVDASFDWRARAG